MVALLQLQIECVFQEGNILAIGPKKKVMYTTETLYTPDNYKQMKRPVL